MNEFLILIILKKQVSNIYEIKKIIDTSFAPFLSISLGALIPVLKRLEKQNAVSKEESMTAGGLKRTVYSFLDKGDDIINRYLLEPITSAPQILRREIEILMLLIDGSFLSVEQNILLLNKVEDAILKNLKILEDNVKYTKENADFLSMEIEYMRKKLNYIQEFRNAIEQAIIE